MILFKLKTKQLPIILYIIIVGSLINQFCLFKIIYLHINLLVLSQLDIIILIHFHAFDFIS
jgi:hypothetical protein